MLPHGGRIVNAMQSLVSNLVSSLRLVQSSPSLVPPAGEPQNTHRKDGEHAITRRFLTVICIGSCAIAGTLWMDHAHGTRQRRSRGNQGMVRRRPRLDLPAKRSHARW
jgi:hypothetical protein